MTEVELFKFQEKGVRVVRIDGEPWWVANDVCGALGLVNSAVTMERLSVDDLRKTEVIDAMGRTQATYVVNESGLYELIIRSNKPEARPFRRWITSEVLPSIRKTDSYLPVELDPALQRIVDLTVQMQITKNEQDRLAKEQERQAQEVRALAADVSDLKEISPLVVKDAIHTLRDVAHACDTGQNRLSGWLQGEKVLFRDHAGGLRVKQDWMERGWATDRYERWQNGGGWAWVTYFTPAGLAEVKRRWRTSDADLEAFD